VKELPRIVELAGPAGAGKTTLASMLEQSGMNILRADIPSWREPNRIPFYVRNTLTLLPALMQMFYRRNGKWLQRWEVADMVILEGWPRMLRRQAAACKEVLLLDQGPIYMLAAGQVIGSGVLNSPQADGWRRRMVRQWANTLDMVIWLDAPNATLVSRVRGRDRWHGQKARSERAAFKFLDDYRQAYEQIFSALVAERSDLRIVRFDSARASVEEVGSQVGAALGLDRHKQSNGSC